jgi:glutathione peroxidase
MFSTVTRATVSDFAIACLRNELISLPCSAIVVLISKDSQVKTIYTFEAKDIGGKERSLAEFAGKALLVVNVASRCGFTPQYTGLQSLYDRFRARGFEILAFPANDFLGQEPGTDADIKSFCSQTYGVTFPLFAKISVKGKSIHPLYAFLTGKETNPKFAGKIRWNFGKFLVDRAGDVVDRFGSGDDPMGDRILRAVEAALDIPGPDTGESAERI